MKKGRKIKEAKAERVAKRKRARRRKRVIVLLAELFILGILLCVGFVMNKYGKFQLNMFDKDEIKYNAGVKSERYTTIALFGGDSREGGLGKGTHADTIMLISIDNESKGIRFASVYRDLLVVQTHGGIDKANHAYFSGGPKDMINVLNQNFDLTIENYVTLDFSALVDVVELLGGIEVNVSEDEAIEVNRYIDAVAVEVNKTAIHIKSGTQVLDGVQTLTYARIRKNVGGDYGRTERQRYVIQQIASKAKSAGLVKINEIIDNVFEQISTNFTLSEMLSLASGVLKYEIVGTSGFSFEYTDGIVEGLGSVVIPLGVTENVQELHAFLYPEESYSPSDTVKEIASEIETLTGKTRADYTEQSTTETSEE